MVVPVYGGQEIERQLRSIKKRRSGSNRNSWQNDGPYEKRLNKNEFRKNSGS